MHDYLAVCRNIKKKKIKGSIKSKRLFDIINFIAILCENEKGGKLKRKLLQWRS